jgi:tyrosyl-tRNA synthetase
VGQPRQQVFLVPLLVGTDGTQKMSKSLGNYIGVTDGTKDMFGKTMSIADEMMKEWYTLLTDIPAEEIAVLCDSGKTHPRAAKIRLAKAIVTRYHDSAAADSEERLWQSVMVEGGLRDDIPQVSLARDECDAAGAIWLPKLLKLLALAPSTSEGRRLIAGGGVSVNQEKISDPQAKVTPTEGMLVQVGKRKAARIAM